MDQNILSKIVQFLGGQAQKAGQRIAQPAQDYSAYRSGKITRPEFINRATESVVGNPLIGGMAMEAPQGVSSALKMVKPKVNIDSDTAQKIVNWADYIGSGFKLDPHNKPMHMEAVKMVNKVVKKAYPEAFSQGRFPFENAIKVAKRLANENSIYRYVKSGGFADKIK